MEYQEWDEILMIILIFSKKLGQGPQLGVYKIMRNTVCRITYFQQNTNCSFPVTRQEGF